ncbi:hypothetical protein SAZ11_35690 [Streptomyces sp. FXJ1.4098]|uniref:hypothetical protein n=1 Tax=Streptomyces sp. NPDC020845 TaxID=3365096 RepID=UPI002997C532|nr:hypothetical protein [Streptomyces sp. FXJ1.4098]
MRGRTGEQPDGRFDDGRSRPATPSRRTASGLGVTLVPNDTVRQIQPPAPYRPLTERADIVELSLVSRDGAREPLAEEFQRIASAPHHPQQRTP